MPHLTPSAPHPCLNCGTPLQGGWEYCPACGQKNEELKLPLKHILEEVAEGIWHFDSKFWATVKGIFTRPGKITAEFLDGHRVRYVPPIRLYVFVSFVFFFLLSTLSHRADESRESQVSVVKADSDGFNFNYTSQTSPDTLSAANKADAEAIEREKAHFNTLAKEGVIFSAKDAAHLKALPDSLRHGLVFDSLLTMYGYRQGISEDPSVNQRRHAKVRERMKEGDYAILLRPLTARQSLVIRVLVVDSLPLDSANIHCLLHGSGAERAALFHKYRLTSYMDRFKARRMARLGELRIDEGNNPFQDPALLGSLIKTTSIGMFLLMPITALLMFLLFGRSRRYYTEHLIHALHLHAAFFVTAILLVLLPVLFRLPDGIARIAYTLFGLNVLVYPLLSIKRVYRQGWAKTAFKYLLMAVGYTGLLILFVVGVLLYLVATY